MTQAEPRKNEKGKHQKPAHGVDLKPTDYQPSKAELEADARLPASFDQVVDSLFAEGRQAKSIRDR